MRTEAHARSSTSREEQRAAGAACTGAAATKSGAEERQRRRVPAWVQDYALFLLDADGQIAAWYAGAERIYGYKSDEVIGQHVSVFYPREEARGKLQEKLKRAADEGHVGSEGWQTEKGRIAFLGQRDHDGAQGRDGDLQGFAAVVRDFSDRHERDEKLRRSRARLRPLPAESTIAGIVSGEFDRIPEANDAFLELVGYSREDLQDGPAALARSHAARISRRSMNWRMKKACGSAPARRSRKN